MISIRYSEVLYRTGRIGLHQRDTKIDLAILDVMLPDIDGFQILKTDP